MRAAVFFALLGVLAWAGSLPAQSDESDRATDALKRLSPPAENDSPATPSGARPEEPSTEPSEGSFRATPEDNREAVKTVDGITRVIVLPVHEAISRPNQYILRRGMKEAIAADAGVVVLEIDTPGGRVDVMLEIMEQLDRYQGHVVAYVNDEAVSAGALIASVADEIWYAPKAVIGSAGIVAGSGQEIPETMRQKVDSYLRAKLRAMSGPHPYRERVVRAMMDASYELEIDGEVISPEGEMLNLTAEEALRHYGDPPRPLFGDGIAEDLETLLDTRFGADQWELREFEVTWSENLAMYLSSIAPILIAFGIVGLFIEFKTPGFGIFGVVGVACLGIVFITNYVAGLAGWEAFLVMLLGIALIVVDLFLLPGTFVLGIIGGVLVIGSILWSMTDIWPTFDGSGFDIRWDTLLDAAARLSLGVILGVVLIAVVWRLLPHTHLLDRLVLGGASGVQGVPEPQQVSQTAPGASSRWPQPGATGIVTRTLRPSGEVEIDGRRYEARVAQGVLERGEGIRVISRGQFGLEVENWTGADQ